MIIISQDKRAILNFNKIVSLELGEHIANMDGEREVTIEAVDECTNFNRLVYYKTEERAKEVLQEIITRYKNWENMKVGQPSGVCLPVYEMPKE